MPTLRRGRWQRTRTIVVGRALAGALLASMDSSSPLGHDLLLRALREVLTADVEATLLSEERKKPTSGSLKNVDEKLRQKLRLVEEAVTEVRESIRELALLSEVNTLVRALAERDIGLVLELQRRLQESH